MGQEAVFLIDGCHLPVEFILQQASKINQRFIICKLFYTIELDALSAAMSSNLLVYMIIKRVRAGFVLSMEAKNIYVAVVIGKIGKNYLY